MHFWLAQAIPWLQKLSLVEVGQCSIVCIWDMASRVRTSAHCVSPLGASGLRLIIPLGVTPLFLKKGSNSQIALYHIWHLKDENSLSVPVYIAWVTFLFQPSWFVKALSGVTLWYELHCTSPNGLPLWLQNQETKMERRNHVKLWGNSGARGWQIPHRNFVFPCPFLLILEQPVPNPWDSQYTYKFKPPSFVIKWLWYTEKVN